MYVAAARGRGEDIRAMLCLETIGYFRDEKGSQKYPPVLGWFYPARGNFIGFVSNFQSRRLLMRAVSVFTAVSDFPLESIATFASLPGVDWSDHGSFWAAGYPAIMITDTAIYRYPHYHDVSDKPDQVQYDKLARLTDGLFYVVKDLAGGETKR